MTLRVLVADDEPDVRDYLQQVVPRLGHLVVGVACNGVQLVDLARKTRPDLIITDVRMPELSGDDALAELSRDQPTPAILVSAFFPSNHTAQPNQVTLHKPITRIDLAGAIGQLIPAAMNPTS